jgi:hypothetical protein
MDFSHPPSLEWKQNSQPLSAVSREDHHHGRAISMKLLNVEN